MNNTAIAQKLNIVESTIVEIQEWASVLWVRFEGGCRFVSKMIGAKKMENSILFSRETSLGLLEAVKTDVGVDLRIFSQAILIPHKHIEYVKVPQSDNWAPARSKGVAFLAIDSRSKLKAKKTYGLMQSEFNLIKAYQDELWAKKPKSTDDLVSDHQSLCCSISALQNAIIDNKDNYISQGVRPVNTDKMEAELKAEIAKLEEFIAANPTIPAILKDRQKAEVERFLAYD